MRPSLALEVHREAIRRIVAAHRGLNPRVFGSVRRGEDREDSDLDLLVDAGEGMTLFDLAEISAAVEGLIRAKVDVRTPEDLSEKIRTRVVNEAAPLRPRSQTRGSSKNLNICWERSNGSSRT